MQIVILSILLFIVPTIIGTAFAKMSEYKYNLPFYWVSGQVLLWAGFLVISVPLILLQKSFSLLVNLYSVYTGSLLILICFLHIIRKVRGKNVKVAIAESKLRDRSQWIMWGIFFCLLLVQLVLSVCLSYEEGDDAFYVAISTATEKADTMYRTLPYTGLTTQLDARHGLAPFPVWIAYLARISGMITVSVAQVVLPVQIILMSYAVYYLTSAYLFREKKKNIPAFMILIQCMVLFGGYSSYSAENFLLVRATQGKAVIANVIIPFIIYLMFLLLDKIKKEERSSLCYWTVLSAAIAAGCLCSTLGTLLTAMLVALIGICTSLCYRKWKLLIPMVISCMIPVLLALLYFVLR